MQVIKNPAIDQLDPDSLCYSIYRELYNQFFNAQVKKDDEHPYGIEEGDYVSISLHNTAYGFAFAIAGAVDGDSGGGEGGVLLDYLKKTGGDMLGMLRALHGFEAGIENKILLDLYSNENSAGVRVPEDIDIRGSVYLKGNEFLSYDQNKKLASITAGTLDLNDSHIITSGDIIIGKDKEGGIYLSPSMLLVKNNPVFHSGNANLDSVDWSMKDAYVSGNIEIKGGAVLSGKLRAVHGAELGTEGRVMLSFGQDEMIANSFLSFASGYGIKIGGMPVLVRAGEKDIQLSGIGGDLLLGNEGTNKIKLMSGLMDVDGDYMLVSPYGAAYFPDSLNVRHNYGDSLLASYREDSDNEGIIIHKRLRFGSASGVFLFGDTDSINFTSTVERISPETGTRTATYTTTLSHGPSTSLYKPLNRDSDSVVFSTEADFFRLNKPLEAKNHIGIDNSFTRLTDGSLFLSDNSYLLSVADGIKHFGNAYFVENISSERFSSGLAGSGWAVQHNRTTGNTVATFDELTVRKRMRVYEFEVQKANVTNGSLWISDHCQGDTVIRVG